MLLVIFKSTVQGRANQRIADRISLHSLVSSTSDAGTGKDCTVISLVCCLRPAAFLERTSRVSRGQRHDAQATDTRFASRIEYSSIYSYTARTHVSIACLELFVEKLYEDNANAAVRNKHSLMTGVNDDLMGRSPLRNECSAGSARVTAARMATSTNSRTPLAQDCCVRRAARGRAGRRPDEPRRPSAARLRNSGGAPAAAANARLRPVHSSRSRRELRLYAFARRGV